MKEEILKLRAEGKTFNEIKDILGCSKGTISYHCSEGQKEKTINRKRKSRKDNPLMNKINVFRDRVRDFQRNRHNGTFVDGRTHDLNMEEVLNKIGDNPKCYLTGRDIDIYNTSAYHLDHIHPVKKGGDNSIANLGIACKDANFAKRDLLLEDFIQLCKDVLGHQGYTITKGK